MTYFLRANIEARRFVEGQRGIARYVVRLHEDHLRTVTLQPPHPFRHQSLRYPAATVGGGDSQRSDLPTLRG